MSVLRYGFGVMCTLSAASAWSWSLPASWEQDLQLNLGLGVGMIHQMQKDDIAAYYSPVSQQSSAYNFYWGSELAWRQLKFGIRSNYHYGQAHGYLNNDRAVQVSHWDFTWFSKYPFRWHGVTFEPFLGLGYRHLRHQALAIRNAEHEIVTPKYYDHAYSWYIPVGLQGEYPLGQGGFVRVNAQWSKHFAASYHQSDLGGAYRSSRGPCWEYELVLGAELDAEQVGFDKYEWVLGYNRISWSGLKNAGVPLGHDVREDEKHLGLRVYF